MSNRSSREQILQSVREAIKGIRPMPEESPTISISDISDIPDLPALFSQRLRRAGGEITVVRDGEELKKTLAAQLADLKPERVLLQAAFKDGGFGIIEVVETSATEVLQVEEVALDRAAEADAGVTAADFGIADTGTIVLFHVPGKGRLAALLPPVHIALLERSKLFADKAAFLRYCRENRVDLSGTSMTWVTGPSLTADIEKVLVRGAHGPRRLIVILHSGFRGRG
jgi:L-lactate dehydrogenase complex protein LldG